MHFLFIHYTCAKLTTLMTSSVKEMSLGTFPVCAGGLQAQPWRSRSESSWTELRSKAPSFKFFFGMKKLGAFIRLMALFEHHCTGSRKKSPTAPVSDQDQKGQAPQKAAWSHQHGVTLHCSWQVWHSCCLPLGSTRKHHNITKPKSHNAKPNGFLTITTDHVHV